MRTELDAFLSYSHADEEFVNALKVALEALGRTVWIDKDGIPPGAPWRSELGTAIEAAVLFVFVVTPASVQSKECLSELDRAVELGKRMLPVVLRDASTPSALTSIQWIDARTSTPAATAELVDTAIGADYDWARTHTQWLARALQWESDGNSSSLPRGAELERAEAWLARQAEGHDPPPTELQTAFLTAARARQRKVLRGIAATAVGALAIVAALAFIAWLQRAEAIDQRDLAQSRALAATAASQLQQDPLASLVLAARAQRVQETPESISALRDALTQSRLRRVQRVSSEGIYRLAASGNQVAFADHQGHVWLWSSGTRRELPGLSGRVELLAFADDGTSLTAADERGTVRVWDVDDGGERTLALDRPLHGAATDRAGKRLFVATDTGVDVVSLADGKALGAVESAQPVGQVAVRGDGKTVLFSDAAGAVRMWDLELDLDWPVIEYDQAGTVDVAVSPSVAFSPDDKLALTLGGITATVHDAEIGNPLSQFEAREAVFTPDSRRVISSGTDEVFGSITGMVETHRARSGAVELSERDGGAPADAIALSPDGQLVATGSALGPVRVWDRKTGETRLTLVARHAAGADLLFSADGRRLTTAGGDGVLREWDVTGAAEARTPKGEIIGAAFDRTGERVMLASRLSWAGLADSHTGVIDASDPAGCIPYSGMTCLAFGVANLGGHAWKAPWGKQHYAEAAQETPQPTLADLQAQAMRVPYSADMNAAGTLIAIGTAGGTVAVLDAHTGVLRTPELHLDHRVEAVRFAPDGDHLVAATGNVATIIETRSGHSVARLPHPESVNGLTFVDNGATVATAAADGIVRRFRVSDGRSLGSGERLGDGHLDIDTANSGLIAVADGDGVVLSDGSRITGQSGQVSVVAVSPDGAFVAAGGSGPTVTVWERATRRLVATFSGARGAISTLRFSPDGRRLLAASDDGVARIYDCDACAQPEALLKLAEARAAIGLTEDERTRIVGAVVG